jgi:uncharacterized protein YecE (DUF72 family)
LADHHIRLGLASYALAGKGVRKAALRTRLTKYAEYGFSLLEYDLTLPQLPSDDTLRALFSVESLDVFWHVSIEDVPAALRFFSRPEWNAFIANLAEQRLKGVRNTVVIALDRSVRYSAEFVDPLLAAWQEIDTYVPCVLEFEQGGWKKIESLLVRSKVPRIELDAPPLPAIVKPLSGEDRKRSYLKLVGRNAKAWLEHEPVERYCYTYSASELQSIATRVLDLRSRSDEVAILLAHYPAEAAYHNALELAIALCDRLETEGMPA